MRLAMTLGVVEVDSMLDSITPAQFNEWIAFNALEPIGNDWDQAATIAATLHNEMESIRCMFGGQKKPEFHNIEDYVPTAKPKRKKVQRMTVQEMVDRAKLQAGVL